MKAISMSNSIMILERYEKKQSFPGYKNKLMVEGMLFQIMEVKAA